MTVDVDNSIERDHQIWRGPLKNRNCTDIPCLLIFLFFVLSWFGVGYYALFVGDLNVLLVPTDSKGRKCGIDSEVIEKPVLVFFDIKKCFGNRCNTTQVCQEKCPQENWSFKLASSMPINTIRNSMLCEDGINVMNKSISELEELIESGACAEWYLKSEVVLKRCIPIPSALNGAIDYISKKELDEATGNIKIWASVQNIMEKITLEQNQIILFIIGSMLLGLLYIILLRWFALPCIWIGIISVVGLLSFLSYLFYNQYMSHKSTGWIVGAGIFAGVAILIALIVVCLWKRINLACRLIGETSKATTDILSLLFFPIFPWIVTLILIIYSITIVLFLISIKNEQFVIEERIPKGHCQCLNGVNYTHGDLCLPHIFYKYCHEGDGSCFSMSCHLNNTETSSSKYFLYGIHLVGFLWLYFFNSDFKKIIIASTYVTWYWTFSKKNIPFFTVFTSFWRIVKYHLGTVAFGSILITICRIFRIFLEYLHSTSQNQFQPSAFVGFLKNCSFYCAKCCLCLLEKFLKFMNRNAYIMCAINGKGLCASAADALSLIVNNAVRSVVLKSIVSWLLRLGKLLITIIITLLAWWYFYVYKDDDHDYRYVPIIIIGVASYIVASVFLSVYGVGVDTIFLCVLQDYEYNDGSSEKPYYMSRNVAKLMNVN